ncbi:glycosyltransferase [Mucilaginibacter sp. E4BP6]|uniref:glycosyltransferase n=1 Tax=Mucilaginibacter sp. E4BP6 TaxID=2723089 RepID=UPI0015C99A7E|nr:glycosyltransferase [Mucilaginibacter sp. E4BP6]NYE68157.1 glycosyltransferase involved in cell wall biosynthesis [Mucilaginibacter sp. E4BP6]
MKDLNIIIYLASLKMGGAERQAIYIAEYLKFKKNMNVRVLALSQPGEAAELLDKLNIPWEILPLPKFSKSENDLDAITQFIVEFEKYKAEIILTFTFHPNILFNMIWQYTGAKICIWNQADAGIGFGFTPIKSNLFKIFSLKNKSYVFISNSLEGKQFLESYFPGRLQVNLIHNGTDLPVALNNREEWRRKIGIEKDSFVAVKIANLTFAKDHTTLIKAWKILITEWPFTIKPVLVFAGRLDENFFNLKKMVDEFDLQNNVFFLGHVDDISGLLGASDLGVFSSRSEGIPNGILECMFSKLPVIATDLIGIREALGDNNDFLVKVGNSTEFATKILNIAGDYTRMKSIGEENYQRVIKEFSLETMLANYFTLITEHLN